MAVRKCIAVSSNGLKKLSEHQKRIGKTKEILDLSTFLVAHFKQDAGNVRLMALFVKNGALKLFSVSRKCSTPL